MRQIYTSPRVENVDRVVAMLNDAGIATSVTNRRAYAGHDYRRPSYAKPPDRETWPQVWVVNANDQIEYTAEDPSVRAMFEHELDARGLTSLMPDEVYTDPDYVWK